jgi:hypothetical protein
MSCAPEKIASKTYRLFFLVLYYPLGNWTFGILFDLFMIDCPLGCLVRMEVDSAEAFLYCFYFELTFNIPLSYQSLCIQVMMPSLLSEVGITVYPIGSLIPYDTIIPMLFY